jgi:hypothetical protein
MKEFERARLFNVVDGVRLIEGYGQDWTWNVVDYLIEEGVKLEVKGSWLREEAPQSHLSLSRNQGFVDNSIYKCSECGRTRALKTNFCPCCGAKMITEGS